MLSTRQNARPAAPTCVKIMAQAQASGLLTGRPAELARQFAGLLRRDLMVSLLLGVAPSGRNSAKALAVPATPQPRSYNFIRHRRTRQQPDALPALMLLSVGFVPPGSRLLTKWCVRCPAQLRQTILRSLGIR